MARRETAAFVEFAAGRSAALHRTAYLMVGDHALAQDLVQEALTKTYVAWPRLRDPSAAEAYTRKAITTTAISWWRKRSSTERPSDTRTEHGAGRHPGRGAQATPEDEVVDRDWLWQALLRLPARQRAAIVLRYYEDLSIGQTAEAMGCAAGTVKSQVSAALSRLRDELGTDVELLPSHEMVAIS